MKQLGVTVEHICLFLNVINSTHDEAVLSKYETLTSVFVVFIYSLFTC